MGIMLFYAFVLLVVCACLIVPAIAVSFDQFDGSAKAVYRKIAHKVYWNAFIRYIFHGTLLI